ncbi:MAG: MMPL family transporter [Rhizobiaceae bacterium]
MTSQQPSIDLQNGLFAWPARAGLGAARHPIVALVIVLALSLLAGIGVSRISSDFTISSMYASDTALYQRYLAFKQAFPLNERSVVVVLESGTAPSRTQLEWIRDAQFDLTFMDEVESVISVFSIPGSSRARETGIPFFADDVPDGDELADRLDRMMRHPVSSNLIGRTDDGRHWLALLVNLTPAAVEPGAFADFLAAAEAAFAASGEHGLSTEILGIPVMEHTVKTIGGQDRVTFNVAGLLVGLAVCVLYFRQPKYVVATVICPVLTVLWTFGAIGLAGMPLSLFMNTAPPLLMVVGFANAMHLVHGVRRNLAAGEPIEAAIRNSVLHVGPACFLASATTAVAFLSLLANASGGIRDFAVVGAIGMVAVFVSGILIVPAAARLTFKPADVLRPTGDGEAGRDAFALGRLTDAVGGWIAPRFLPLTLAGIVALPVMLALHLQLETRHQMSRQIPASLRDRIERVSGSVRLASPTPIYVMVTYPAPVEAHDDAVAAVLRELTTRLGETTGNHPIWSMLVVRDAVTDGGEDHGAAFADTLRSMPPAIRGWIVDEKTRTALLTIQAPDMEVLEIEAFAGRIGNVLDRMAASHPRYSFEQSGLAIVSADHALKTIPGLQFGMLIAIAIVIVLIALFFGSAEMAMLAILPNILPIVATGTMLALLGWGIDYAGVIALTVAFGIAVDDTVHFLARYRLERSRNADVGESVRLAVSRIGPVIVLTTLVLVAGIMVTQLGQMPQTRVFGVLCTVTLVFALVADLFLLPATILFLERLKARRAGAGAR